MDYSIRAFRREDIADLARAANHADVADGLRDAFPYPYLLSDAAQFIQEAIEGTNPRTICRAICADDTVIGCVSITKGTDVYSRTGELGYFIAPAFRGRGIAPVAVRQLCGEVLADGSLDRIYAVPFSTNHASHRVLEKAGFTLESTMKNSVHKNGRTIDAYMYTLIPQFPESGQ